MKNRKSSFLFAGLLFFLSGPAAAQESQSAVAVFAGGSFYSVESAFDKVNGVQRTTNGFMGGAVENPSFQQVANGGTGHKEVVLVTYDPKIVSYQMLLDTFWHIIDPTDQQGQFCDKGDQYMSAVFFATEAERNAAISSKLAVQQELGKPVTTRIIKAEVFYPAEAFHQDFAQKNDYKYMFYRRRCKRDAGLEEVWGRDAITEGE